jgi:CBS domain-containing protein
MIPLDQVPQLTEDERAVDALAELSGGANRGLVVDNGHLSGLLSITDLARALEVGRTPAQSDLGSRGRGLFEVPSEPPANRRSS